MPASNIKSNAFVGLESVQTIDSDVNILAPASQTITSGSFVGSETSKFISSDTKINAPVSNAINSNTTVLLITEQTISSDTNIRAPIILYAKAQVDIPGESELEVETDVSNPVPSAPITLVATDAGLGDVINLTWSSSAPYHNVYRKDGAVLTKLNPSLLGAVTSYSAGGLEPNVPVTFIVKGVNGLGDESTESNEATATPTLAPSRFTEFEYEVKVNGEKQSDAILQEVNLAFGSNFSTATFTLPRDPRGSGNPDLDDEIDVIVNSKLIFRGKITNLNNSIDENGLVIFYTCNSDIIDLTHTTLYEIGLDGGTSRFNISYTQSDGRPATKAIASASTILGKLGITGGPATFPGYVDMTDLTPLAGAELVLSKIGNYKIYHDMLTGENSVYQFGSKGFQQREFTIGKNVLDYKVKKSNLDAVNQVIVVGAPIKVRQKRIVTNFSTIAKDPDGKLSVKLRIVGKNVSGIQVYGNITDKPSIEFNDQIQVALNDFESPFGTNKFKQAFQDFESRFRANSFFLPNVSVDNFSDPDLVLRPAIADIDNNSPRRQSIGAKIVYTGNDIADIFLSEVPKRWFANTKAGQVKRSTLGLSGDPDGLVAVEVLLDYDFTVSSVEVEYTTDANPPVAVAGSGTPYKSITDSQYQMLVDNVSKISTVSAVSARMTARANGELAKLTKETISGSITVVGDETIDLRNSVKAEGELLEISGVKHTFRNGFTTTVELTNEPFFRTIVFGPIFTFTQPKQQEKNKKEVESSFRAQQLAELAKEIQREKDNIEKTPPKTGPYAIYSD